MVLLHHEQYIKSASAETLEHVFIGTLSLRPIQWCKLWPACLPPVLKVEGYLPNCVILKVFAASLLSKQYLGVRAKTHLCSQNNVSG